MICPYHSLDYRYQIWYLFGGHDQVSFERVEVDYSFIKGTPTRESVPNKIPLITCVEEIEELA